MFFQRTAYTVYLSTIKILIPIYYPSKGLVTNHWRTIVWVALLYLNTRDLNLPNMSCFHWATSSKLSFLALDQGLDCPSVTPIQCINNQKQLCLSLFQLSIFMARYSGSVGRVNYFAGGGYIDFSINSVVHPRVYHHEACINHSSPYTPSSDFRRFKRNCFEKWLSPKPDWPYCWPYYIAVTLEVISDWEAIKNQGLNVEISLCA